MNEAWEDVVSVDVVGDTVVIRRYEGGNLSLKAAVASSRCDGFLATLIPVVFGNVPNII